MMNRRQAIRNLSLGAGYIVAAPAVFNLLQSCKSDHTSEWEPQYLSPANGFALTEILDIILPKTDTPGASDLNLAQFIDSYMNEVAGEKEKESFNAGANALAINFKSTFDKEISDGERKEFEELIKKYLGAEKTQREDYLKRLSAKQDPEEPEVELDTDASSYGYLDTVRNLGIWAWKNSEAVGEKVLWYDPIPGQQIGCMDLGEQGNGKAMAL